MLDYLADVEEALDEWGEHVEEHVDDYYDAYLQVPIGGDVVVRADQQKVECAWFLVEVNTQ